MKNQNMKKIRDIRKKKDILITESLEVQIKSKIMNK